MRLVHFPRLILAALMLLQLSCSQSQPVPKCTLSLTQAPSIRGVHLGMTVPEIKALTTKPIISETMPVDRFGYSQWKIEGFPPEFAGIDSFELGLLDGRVFIIIVKYKYDETPNDEREFLSKVSTAFQLPNEWEQTKEGQLITCDGFFIRANYRIVGGTFLWLVNPAEYAKFLERGQAEKDREKEEEKRKRENFTP